MKSEIFERIINEMPKATEFTKWFEYDLEKQCWKAVQYEQDGSTTVEYSEMIEGEHHFMSGMEDEFLMFKKRPEYYVMQSVDFTGDIKYQYIRILIGCLLMRFRRIVKSELPDAYIPRIQRCVEWLEDTDFYAAPASTQYHESFEGGLLVHTAKVHSHIIRLLQTYAFNKCCIDSAVLVGLCHDWCKIGLYESFMRNVKDDNGNWVQVESFKHAENIMIPLGHGVSSMFLMSRFLNLSASESLAIRWHMGPWNVAPNEMNDLQAANEKEPLVHLLQFADQLSITNYSDAILGN